MIRGGPLLLAAALLASSPGRAQFRPQNPEDDDKVQLDQLVNACLTAQSRDALCDTIIQIRQIGDDAVEMVKTYVKLGPFEYAMLTVANFAVTGRLRVKTQPLFYKDVENTIDYNTDGTVSLVLEKDL